MNALRSAAKASGNTRYMPENPCKHGHVSERYVANDACLQCHTESAKAWREKPGYAASIRDWRRRTGRRCKSGRNAEQQRAYYAEHIEKLRPRSLERRRKTNDLIKAATPKWVDPAKIKSLREQARELSLSTGIPHEVDHFVPLRGDGICGLHVHDNLRVIPRSVNRSKKNTLPDMAPMIARVIAKFPTLTLGVS